MRPFVSGMLAASTLLLIGCSESVEPKLDQRVANADQSGVPDVQSHGTRYIVVLKDRVADVAESARQAARAHQGTLHFVYERAIKGFAITVPEQAAEALSRNPNVLSVDIDRPAVVFTTGLTAQSNTPPWGLDRLDQRDLPLDHAITFENPGAGVNIYVIDSGLRITHNEFGGRAHYVPSAENGNFVGDGRGNANDCYGHGTRVAAIAAGSNYGVAKGATIWAARVLDCDGWGYASMAVAAVDWITANGQLPAVVNMSLGYGDVPALQTAVENSIAAGFNYTVAAGNQIVPFDACTQTPANAPNALTVGATSATDEEASWSAYGNCVDLLAPGVDIVSAWHTGNNATSRRSGTSSATPHVAGSVAVFLAANGGASVSDVTSAILASATVNRIALHGFSAQNGTPNLLLHTNFQPVVGPLEEPNDPPSAGFSMCSNVARVRHESEPPDIEVEPEQESGLVLNLSASRSADSDGWITDYLWDFGDGATAFGVNASHTYAEEGTYEVRLTVLDNDGAVTTATQVMRLAGRQTTLIELSAAARRLDANLMSVDLNWSGTDAPEIDVFRNGDGIACVPNTGSYSERLPESRQWQFYQVCQELTPEPSRDLPTELD